MKYEFDVVIEKDSTGHFVASVPELPGCHTQAKSIDTLIKRIKEAIELCLEEYGKIRQPREFIGLQRVTLEA